MSRYFRFSFIIDIIGMIIIINDFIGSSYDLSIYVLNFLVFLKIYDVLKVNRQLYKLTNAHDNLRVFYEIFQLIVVIFYLAHMVACVFLWISLYCIIDLKINEEDTWAGSYQLYSSIPNDTIYRWLERGDNWGLPYLYGMWSSIGNMVTLGSDIDPLNPYEVVVTLISAFISIILYGFVISFVGIIINNIYERDQSKVKSILAIDKYMANRNIDRQLRSKVEAYIEFIFDRDNFKTQTEVIEKLNGNLK